MRAKIENNVLFGRALVRIKTKIEKNTLFGGALVSIMTIIEKKLFVRALVRFSAKIE